MTSGRPEPKRARKARPDATSASLWRALAAGCFAVLLYANTLGHGYVLDDDIATRRNAFVQKGVGGLVDIFTHGYAFGFNGMNSLYRPVALASLALDKDLFGESAGAHHAVNVALFGLTVVGLYLLLAGLLDARRARDGGPASGTDPGVGQKPSSVPVWFVPLATALIFAAHPIHTEVVANIKGRDDLLACFFGVAALVLLLRHLDTRSSLAWIGSALCCLLAALSKESGIAFILLVPLTVWFFRPASLKRLPVLLVPYLVSAALFVLLYRTYTDPHSGPESIINNALVAAADAGTWFASRVAILGRYLMLLVVPYPLSYDYSYNQVPLVGPGAPGFIASLVVYLALAVVAVWGFRRRRPLSYAIAFFAITLVPVSNLVVPLGTVMAERLIFAPSAAFCLAAAWGLAQGGSRWGARWGMVATTVIVVTYGVLTVVRNRDWKDQGTLLASGLRSAPRSARVQNHYGTWLRERGEALPAGDPERARLLESALPYYTRALAILPGYAEASYDMGVTCYDLDDLSAARTWYRRAVLADSTWSAPLNNLGVVHFRSGEYDSARAVWLRLTRLDPRNADAFYKVGGTYYEQARRSAQIGEAEREAFRQAIAWLERAWRIDPGFSGSAAPLVESYRAIGDTARARQWEAGRPATGTQ